MIKYIFIIIFIYSIRMLYAEQKDYEAVYEPLNCVGIAIDYEKMYIANWKFFPTGGSGSEIDIRYNNIKRVGKIRTTVYESGNLYGRGKWIGRTSSRIYNTLIEINYDHETKYFDLKSQFNPDQFRIKGKCK